MKQTRWLSEFICLSEYTRIYPMCFRFLRQVLDETLRCSVFGMFAARFQDVDSKLGGYNIPKNVGFVELGTILYWEKID